MRIDLPGCSFKNCKYCSDGNCTNQSKYENCDYKMLKDEFLSGQLALQKEIEKLDGLLVCKNKTITDLTVVINCLNDKLKAAKSDAGIEFAERLKEKLIPNVCCGRLSFTQVEYELNKLVKETEEKTDG